MYIPKKQKPLTVKRKKLKKKTSFRIHRCNKLYQVGFSSINKPFPLFLCKVDSLPNGRDKVQVKPRVGRSTQICY